jgi:signal transduction histidine kinase
MMRNMSVLPSSAADLSARVLREQVASLYATVREAALADFVVAMVFAALMYWQTRDGNVLWWAGLHIAQAARMPLLLAYFRDPQAAARSAHWARVHARELLINSSVWGLAPWLFLPAQSLPLTSLMMLLMLGLSAAGAISVAPLRKSIFTYVAPMLLGLAGALAWNGGLVNWFLAGCALLYLAVVLKFALQQHALLTDALVTRFDKEALAEQLSAQMAATQRASEEKTRFLATASHDLRQPLHAIALFGAVLERELRGAPQWTHASRLMHAVDTLRDSLSTMLDVSRLDAGVVTPALQSVRLTEVLQSLYHVFAPKAEEKKLQLRLRASPLWVHSDPALLSRMLFNLVDNALKYTPSGGVLVRARARGDAVWLEVHDTGIGIAPEYLERIFEEFYQVDNPGRDRAQGLGIGLSIVQRLSRLLAHPLQVRSRPARGTCFRVVLPAAPAGVQAPMPRVAEFSRSGRYLAAAALPQRILIVDDEADIREASGALLQGYAADVQAVANEAQAAVALRQAQAAGTPFEALICDYRLGDGADGLEAGQRLQRSLAPQAALLLITGETSPERLQRVRDAQVPVLFKPVKTQELIDMLAALHRPVDVAL